MLIAYWGLTLPEGVIDRVNVDVMPITGSLSEVSYEIRDACIAKGYSEKYDYLVNYVVGAQEQWKISAASMLITAVLTWEEQQDGECTGNEVMTV